MSHTFFWSSSTYVYCLFILMLVIILTYLCIVGGFPLLLVLATPHPQISCATQPKNIPYCHGFDSLDWCFLLQREDLGRKFVCQATINIPYCRGFDSLDWSFLLQREDLGRKFVCQATNSNSSIPLSREIHISLNREYMST